MCISETVLFIYFVNTFFKILTSGLIFSRLSSSSSVSHSDPLVASAVDGLDGENSETFGEDFIESEEKGHNFNFRIYIDEGTINLLKNKMI